MSNLAINGVSRELLDATHAFLVRAESAAAVISHAIPHAAQAVRTRTPLVDS